MNENQQAAVSRAREALNKALAPHRGEPRDTYELINDLGFTVGTLAVQLQMMIDLVAELDNRAEVVAANRADELAELRRGRASCGHVANADGECDCSWWPERAPLAGTLGSEAGDEHQADELAADQEMNPSYPHHAADEHQADRPCVHCGGGTAPWFCDICRPPAADAAAGQADELTDAERRQLAVVLSPRRRR